MNVADLIARFAATQYPAAPLEPQALAGLLASVQSIQEQLDETTQAVNQALTALNEFMGGVEKIDKTTPLPPTVYVDYETYARLLARVSAIQSYLISVQRNLPSILTGINEVPK